MILFEDAQAQTGYGDGYGDGYGGWGGLGRPNEMDYRKRESVKGDKMSETPRTDAAIMMFHHCAAVPIRDCASIERDLTDARAENAALKEERDGYMSQAEGAIIERDRLLLENDALKALVVEAGKGTK